jgi:hypothetical protein
MHTLVRALRIDTIILYLTKATDSLALRRSDIIKPRIITLGFYVSSMRTAVLADCEIHNIETTAIAILREEKARMYLTRIEIYDYLIKRDQ